MAITEKFNTSAEKHLQNRVSAYNLNQNETANIWEISKERDQKIQQEKNDFNTPEIYDARFQQAYDDIRARENPQPQLNYARNPQNTDHQVRVMARNQVIQNRNAAISSHNQTCDKKIDAVFQNARADGRGPQNNQQQNQRSLTNEFNNAHDHNR
jgi:hypothetical protein